MKASVRKTVTPRRRQLPRGNERRLVTEHPRRQILSLAAGAAALPAVSRMAWGQAYPTRPVRWIVGFPPGGGTDITARLMGQWLAERLGRPFVIENRPGANGNIGTEAVVNALADGYTLLLLAGNNTISATLYDKLNFNLVRDIAPVAGIMLSPNILVVNPSFPARTLPEFIANAKANPGKINFASSGVGSGIHLSGELFKMMANVDMVHVPYRGSAPALTDLIGGQVQAMFADTASSIEYVKAGKLRALAVTTATRLEALPELPTVGEFLPGYEARGWYGVGAPQNTPSEIVAKLNREINAGLADTKIKARLAELGGVPFARTPNEFGKHIAEDIERWAKAIKFSGAKPG
jgi:tripartite-type tricarboxylate transporter receptor subunit TctC